MSYINKPNFIAASIVFPLVSLLTVGARFHSRRLKKQTLGVDDLLCLPAWLLTTGCSVALVVGVAMDAVGAHSIPDKHKPFPAKQIQTIERIEFAFLLMFILGLGCIKLSILFFYRRIFTSRIFKALNWCLVVLVVAWMIAFFFVSLFDCRTHFDADWPDLHTKTTMCVPPTEKNLANAASDVAIDLVIMVLPMPMVWKLQMPFMSRISVIFTFCLGAFSISCGFIRLIFQAQNIGIESTTKTIFGLNSKDVLGIDSLFIYWHQLELGVAMITCCLPSLKPVFQELSFKSFFSGRASTSPSDLPTKEPSEDKSVASSSKSSLIRKISDTPS